MPVSLLFLPFFHIFLYSFKIPQGSSILPRGTATAFFFLFLLMNDCGGQTVALNEMAPAPNCIPTWGRQAGVKFMEDGETAK